MKCSNNRCGGGCSRGGSSRITAKRSEKSFYYLSQGKGDIKARIIHGSSSDVLRLLLLLLLLATRIGHLGHLGHLCAVMMSTMLLTLWLALRRIVSLNLVHEACSRGS